MQLLERPILWKWLGQRLLSFESYYNIVDVRSS